jgi:hypothetical protein
MRCINILVLLLSIALTGCDSGLVAQSSTFGSGSNQFAAAQKVIQTSCVGCHSVGGSAAFLPLDMTSEDEFLQAGLVVKGKPFESSLIKRLRHYGSADSNMPPMGLDFTTANYNKIVDWVKNINSNKGQIFGEFTCEASADPIPDKMLRLKKDQFINSLNYIQSLTDYYLVSNVTQIPSINEFLILIPEDYGNDKFGSFDQSISDDHVENYYKAIEKFAVYITNPHAAAGNSRIKRIVTMYSGLVDGLTGAALSNCLLLNKAGSESCYRQFIKAFGLAAFRRQLSDSEIDFYYSKINIADDKQEIHRVLVTYLLSSPYFLFRIEEHGLADAGIANYKKLSNYEVAAKLSYTFWNDMPNLELLALAKDSKLTTDAGFQEGIDLIFSVANQDKIKNVLKSFYDEYLMFSKLPRLNAFNTTEFNNFAAGENINSSGYNHRTDMINEIYDMLNYYTWENPSDFSTVLSTRKYFAKTPALAKLYGDQSRIWDGLSDLNFSNSERAGLLTRVGMLTTGEHLTSPIHKGVFILRKIICDDVGSPPPLSEDDLLVSYTPDMTTRERVHVLTIENKTSCASCHSKFNPFGYAFEKYDALGRQNLSGEAIYNEFGAITKRVPVNYQTTVNLGGESMVVSSPEELSDKLAETNLPNACYTKNIFEFIKGRAADIKNDGCDLREINNGLSLNEGGNMLNAFKSFIGNKGFRYKKIN